MTRNYASLILAAGCMCFATTAVHAQSYNLRANVPFEFEVKGQSFSPGTYFVTRSMNGAALFLMPSAGKSTILTLAGATEVESVRKPARLTFHRYGNEYFLATVWSSEKTGTPIAISAREKELRSNRTEQLAMWTFDVPLTTAGL